MLQELISVGIDVGTSTTQVMFSKLCMADRGGYFSVPQVDIISRELLWRGNIRETPFLNSVLIDAEALRKIVVAEFRKAGFARKGADTGAVIITGESARKENARSVLESLSGCAGDFVVSTAGPDLEALIAGQGSGAADWSRKNMARVANLDIGGGTTNIAVFDGGEAVAQGAFDVGGRLVRVRDGKIARISEAAKKIFRWKGLALEEGMPADTRLLERLCGAFVEILEMAMRLRPVLPILEEVRTPGSGIFQAPLPLEGIFLSGGVADPAYGDSEKNVFDYGDIGILLGRAIRKSALCTQFPLKKPEETIRATVIGAGNCTIHLSGSTVFYSGPVFPQKNLPVLRLSLEEEAECYGGTSTALAARLAWFLRQNGAAFAALAFRGMRNPAYRELKAAAQNFAAVADEALPEGAPLIILTESDTAKALGQLVSAVLKSPRPLAVLDCLRAGAYSFIDIAPPLAGGAAVPVVIKTLIFG
jgi:ethanolamine utilization protein EutA